ncbi:MAG: hypothetical protein OXU19_12585 [bacterium]|nr:hypothetical protein [bacterium]MDE0240783.1 hypothetical protein [bacterium]
MTLILPMVSTGVRIEVCTLSMTCSTVSADTSSRSPPAAGIRWSIEAGDLTIADVMSGVCAIIERVGP